MHHTNIYINFELYMTLLLELGNPLRDNMKNRLTDGMLTRNGAFCAGRHTN